MAGLTQRGRFLHRKALALALACSLGSGPALATQPGEEPSPMVQNSLMDAGLFFQVLMAELELREGREGNAFELFTDAARKTNDAGLYQRAVDVALHARAGEQALVATRAWRQAHPQSTEALRYHCQILAAMGRHLELEEPLATWLTLLPPGERPGLIASLPRLLQQMTDRQQAFALLDRLLKNHIDAPDTRTAARMTLGRVALAAGQTSRTLELARLAMADDPVAAGPAVLAIELLPGTPEAESLVTSYLAKPDADPLVRMAYVQALTQSQRYADAIAQLHLITRERPELPEPWFTLGALHLELKQAKEAEAALQRHASLLSAPSAGTSGASTEASDPSSARERVRDLTPTWLLLAQAAEQRGDLAASEAWLAKVDNPQRALDVQRRRASLMARQGKLAQARALIQSAPERTAEDAKSKVLAEAQLLRDVKRWKEAGELMRAAEKRFAKDVDVLYELAMIDEKLEQFADMERRLRQVIELKPDHPDAHNALGYSLADRNTRLPEARELIRRALELSPGNPFITDSLGWVEFRLGNRDEALRLLRQAYKSRPDTEIAAHLGEVLWVAGRRDEAVHIWREARGRDAGNEVLRETLQRLKAGL